MVMFIVVLVLSLAQYAIRNFTLYLLGTLLSCVHFLSLFTHTCFVYKVMYTSELDDGVQCKGGMHIHS